MLTQEQLKELLHYDETTGLFTWRMALSARVRIGAVAGWAEKAGYIRIKICGRSYFAHRLAWLYVNGELPPAELDHINRVTDDNRIINLRPATRSENQKNSKIFSTNTSGYKGVCWNKEYRKWQVDAMLNGKKYRLGYFPTAEQASDAYQAFARQHHGALYIPQKGVSV